MRFPIIIHHAYNGGRPCPPFVYNGVPDEMECYTRPCSMLLYTMYLQEKKSNLIMALAYQYHKHAAQAFL